MSVAGALQVRPAHMEDRVPRPENKVRAALVTATVRSAVTATLTATVAVTETLPRCLSVDAGFPAERCANRLRGSLLTSRSTGCARAGLATRAATSNRKCRPAAGKAFGIIKIKEHI